jgi:SAM-dependent methyltransferase
MNTMVRASSQEYAQLLVYTHASQKLNNWINGARVLALLSGADNCGILDTLQTKCTPERIAASTNMDLQSISDLCLALEAHGIVQQDEEGYQLAPDYALLASPGAAIPLTNLIRQAGVMRTLQAVVPAGVTYITLPPEDILAMAGGAGISALSSSPHVSQEATGQMLPEVETLWQAGAHHLEVGCGVGNALFGILMTYPRVTAVGVEIDEITAAEAERRANLLGLKERVKLRMMNACDLQDEDSFDTIQWSQFFFPTHTRPSVLEAMHRALKSAGYLIMPYLGSPCEVQSARRRKMLRLALRAVRSGGGSFLSFINDILGDSSRRRQKERRFASLQRLLFSRWGVPVRSAEELKVEVEDHGFKVLRTLYTPVNQFVLTRGLLLAQREA